MEDIYKQAVEHRYMHEYGDMTIITRQPNKAKVTGGSKVMNNLTEEKKDEFDKGRNVPNKRSESMDSTTQSDR